MYWRVEGVQNPAMVTEDDKTTRNHDNNHHLEHQQQRHSNGNADTSHTNSCVGGDSNGVQHQPQRQGGEGGGERGVGKGEKEERGGKPEMMKVADKNIGPGRLQKMKSAITRATQPLQANNHPMPSHPTNLDKFKRAFFCPPFGRIGAFILVAAMFLLWWGVLISITKEKALPGGVVFPIMILFVCCWCGGYLINLVNLPPLFGMLIVGGILGNVPKIDVGRDIDSDWSSTARNIALTVILIRAGLGLDPIALRKLSFVVLRLAFIPSLIEAGVDSIAVHLILGFPWSWSFMMGFILAVVSPAVVVPSMISLSDRGYGLNKGIPTLVVAAVSLDAVLAITGFGVCLGITFTSGDLVWTLFKGPLEALVGIVFGCAGGVIFWYIPQRSSKHLVLFRSTMLFGGGLISIFGSKYVKWSGAGPLACLCIAFVAGLRWRRECPSGKKTPVEEVMGVLWMVFQPLLFGLIGAKVDLSTLEPQTAGYGIAILFLGLVFRLSMAFTVVQRSTLNLKEKFFIPMAWSPKATVQAAIGGIALDTAMDLHAGTEAIELGRKVLTLAVLAILITAPIGSLLIALSGPRLLHQTVPGGEIVIPSPNALENQEQGQVQDESEGHINTAASLDNE